MEVQPHCRLMDHLARVGAQHGDAQYLARVRVGEGDQRRIDSGDFCLCVMN